MILIGILIGFILGLPIGFIKWKKKTIPVVEKYIRRGILNREFRINENTSGVKSTVHVQYEIGELESTDKLSKVEVIFLTPSQSEYLTDFYKKKFTDLIDKSWVESSEINWITMLKDFSEKATPELCLEWRSLIQISPNDRKSLEKRIGIGEFGFEQAFRIHFNMNWNNCDIETFKKLKRDLKIKQIIDDKL